MQGDWGTLIGEDSGELGWGSRGVISDARRLRLPRMVVSLRQ